MKKILFKGLSFSLAVMLLIGSITLFATDEETETLKVGYVPNYGMESGVFENNTPSRGYGYDFLNKIAEYANWKYEFVNVSFNDGMSMLENGELDIFGPVFKTSDREKQFLYQDIEMGYEYTYVYANENSECYYNDFESLNGKKIGIQKSSVYVDTFNKFAKENNINADVALIESSDFQNQLDLGNVDFVVDGSTLNLNNVKVVAKLGYNGYYYPVSKKRPDVLGKMNAAIEKILQDDIYYRAKLEQKYFTKNSPASFSRQEIEFINQNPVIKVGYNPNWEPIEGTKKGEAWGVNLDIFKVIDSNSPFSFEFVTTQSYEDSIKALQEGKIDVLSASPQLLSDSYGFEYTNKFNSVDVIMLSQKNVNVSDVLIAAVPNLNCSLTNKLINVFTNTTFKNYKSSENSIDALVNGKVDITFLSSYAYDFYKDKLSSKYSSLATGMSFNSCLAVNMENEKSDMLLSILNKTFDNIDNDLLTTQVYTNMVNNTKDKSIRFILDRYSTQIAVLVCLILFIIIGLIIINKNIADKKLKRIAFIDSVTGLSNLNKFKADAAKLLSKASKNQYMIISIDINNFKYINDLYGYDAGDNVLRCICRHFDLDKDNFVLIAKCSADNFVFLVKAMNDSELKAFFEKIINLEDDIYCYLPIHYKLTFCAGAFIINDPNDDLNLMIDCANIARKTMKNKHGNNIAVYNKELHLRVQTQKEITVNMERAIFNKEFLLYLQPKYSLKDDRIIGSEALVRWQNPEHGFLYPDKFIPVFECNGFIKKLDLYMFRQVCKTLSEWKEINALNERARISVNLSKETLNYDNLISDIKDLLKEYNISSKYIEIELTESAVVNNVDMLLNLMQQFKDMGFKVSMDDFGSGYSSLNLLKDLPADIIKIDKEFFNSSANSQKGKFIIQTVVYMAKSLDLEIVAEGVETLEQVDFLKGLECDIAQGYYYSKPISLIDFEEKYLSEFKEMTKALENT